MTTLKGKIMRFAVLSGMAIATALAPAAAQTTGAPAESASLTLSADAGPLQRALEPYAVYQQDVTSLRGMSLNSAADMARALDLSAHHHYPYLARGVIAYGAMAAAQSPAFVQAARDAERYYGREGLITLLTRTPAFARTLRGGPEAGQLAMTAINNDVTRIAQVADRYLGLFSDLTRVNWGRASIRNADARDNELSALGAPSAVRPTPETLRAQLYAAPASVSAAGDPTQFGGAGFWDRVTGGPVMAASASFVNTQQWLPDPQRIVAIDRMLALGALYAIGAETDRSDAFDPMLQEPFLANCFAAAQSGLLGCQQSSSRNHESAFCIAKHALGWGEGEITVNSVALCIGRLFSPAPQATASPVSTPAGEWRPTP
jgi:hypothetical protein